MGTNPGGFLVNYWLKQMQQNLVNEKEDEYVSLVFDNDDRLVEIGGNFDGIPARTRCLGSHLVL